MSAGEEPAARSKAQHKLKIRWSWRKADCQSAAGWQPAPQYFGGLSSLLVGRRPMRTARIGCPTRGKPQTVQALLHWSMEITEGWRRADYQSAAGWQPAPQSSRRATKQMDSSTTAPASHAYTIRSGSGAFPNESSWHPLSCRAPLGKVSALKQGGILDYGLAGR